MAAAGIGITHFPCSLPSPQSKKVKLPIPVRRTSCSHSWTARKMKPSACYSLKPDQQAEESDANAPNDSLISPDDANYLWKLAAGSVGGASVIKYGSILFPEITRPNLLQALLMISLPVVVAVLILIKESSTESQSKDLF